MAESDIEDFSNDFILNRIFPDANTIFTRQFKSLDEIKNDCIVVLDTNTLVFPFTVNRANLTEIERIYKQLINEKRLLIPGHVIREFARIRGEKIKELHHSLFIKKNINATIDNYPLLEGSDYYKNLHTAAKELQGAIKKYSDSIDLLLNQIRDWYWNDPVTALYRNIFNKNTIFDFSVEEKKTVEEFNLRIKHRIPPGYKDSNKENNRLGDFIIWLTILEIASKFKKSVLFVSGETKTDWWVNSDAQNLYPRFELLDEFSRRSDGQSFHILKFSELLSQFGASATIVGEIRNKESLEGEDPYWDDSNRFSYLATTYSAVIRWLGKKRYIMGFEKNAINYPAFNAISRNGAPMAIHIKYIPPNVNNLSDKINQWSAAATAYAIEKDLEFIYVLVTSYEDQTDHLYNTLDIGAITPGFKLLMGFLGPKKQYINKYIIAETAE